MQNLPTTFIFCKFRGTIAGLAPRVVAQSYLSRNGKPCAHCRMATVA